VVGIDFDESTVTHHLAIPLTSSYKEFEKEAKGPYNLFLETFKKAANETFAVDSKIYDDALELIKHLLTKNVKLGIVTNREIRNVLDILKGTEIGNVFDSIITCDVVTNLKPDPEPIIKCLEQLNLNSDEVVYIGDAKNDYLASKNANVDFICIERYNNCDFSCENIIHSLKEIIG
ncbi:MAG: HAD family hydrolase, partial [Bacilli bacterium]|nr:HAD family hydrolase [Bacilli bacterium]